MRFRLYLFLVFLIFLSLELLTTSCARRSSPSGGPRDSTAPQLDTTFPPNETVNFDAKEIELVFNEYLKLAPISSQLTVSPPLEEGIEGAIRGSRILLEIKDTLADSTTYIISFGNAISDLNEGNTNKKIKYVFSTGSYIDSLEIRGRVLRVENEEPEPEMLIGIYDLRKLPAQRDSFMYKQLPNYYAYTGEDGTFEITNMRSGRYLLLAFEDKDSDFKMNSGKERMAFYGDTIVLEPDTTLAYELFSYPAYRKQRFIGASHRDLGKITFSFAKPVEEWQVECLNDTIGDTYQLLSESKDTGFFFFEAELDSLRFIMQKPEEFADTITVDLFENQRKKIGLKPSRDRFRSGDTIGYFTNYPITSIADSIWRYTETDTSKIPTITLSNEPRAFFIKTSDLREGFEVSIPKNTVRSIYNLGNDSTGFNAAFTKKEGLGTLNFTVKVDSLHPYLLQIKSGERTRYEYTVQDSIKLQYKNQLPTKWDAYLIRDRDSSETWTTGSFEQNRQPERIYQFSEQLEIRANWEIGLEWDFRP